MSQPSAAIARSRKPGLGFGWLIALSAIVIAFFFVATPIWLIQPFRAESQSGMALSYMLRQWSPTVTVICLLAIAFALFSGWRKSRWWQKSILSLLLLFTFGLSWLSRQNYFEWMFHSLPKPGFAKAAEAPFVDKKDMVMAVDVYGEAAAFPIRQMAYHHVVQSVIGGKPITVTY